ncbi:MAG: tripartite tricarboxylate transporter substrate binding protein [Betaproteobacteria bacterium]|nr:tripartite tricarboxylate transporter substrate binding protein [Betaproteobacteria bacterium]
MKEFILNLMGLASMAVIALAPIAAAQAQDYPNREIRSICNFAVGSGADILVRWYSDRLSRLSGKPVVVENRPGAQGNIATDLAAKSKPDGYTIMITPGSSTLAAATHLFRKLPFDPIKDFTPVTTVAKLSFALAVNASNPINSIADLKDHLRKKTGDGSYGTGSNTGQVAAELFKEMSSLKTQNVNYKTTGDAMRDLLGGQLDFISYDITFLSGQHRGGKVRVLAMTSGSRVGAFPDIPTLAESGYPGYDLTPWWGVVAPAGTPRPIVERLSAWFNEITNSDETKKFLSNVATDAFPGNADLMAKLIRQDTENWGRFVKLAKIVPE